MSTHVRTVQVIYGYMLEKISRRKSERFIRAHAAERGLAVPEPPLARYWCRPAPVGSPAGWIIGWTAPVVVAAPDPASKTGLIVVPRGRN